MTTTTVLAHRWGGQPVTLAPTATLRRLTIVLLALLGVMLAAPDVAARVAHPLAAAVIVGAGWWAVQRLAPELRPPWRLIVTAVTLLAVHAVIAHLATAAGDPRRDILPVLSISGMALLALGLSRLGHRRGWSEFATALDVLIVGAALATAGWIYISAADLSVPHDWLNTWLRLGLEPILHVLLLFAAIRLLVRTPRSRSAQLVAAAGIATTLLAATTTIAELVGYATAPRLVASTWVAILALAITALLRLETHTNPSEPAPLTRVEPSRAALLLAALMVLPLGILLTANDQRGIIVALMAATILLLTGLRLWLLLHELDRASAARVATQAARDERRFAALVHHMTDVLLVIDDSAAVSYASPSATRLFGADPTGWRVRQLARFIHPQERRATIGSILDRLSHADRQSPIRAKARVLIDDREQFVDMTVSDLRHDTEVNGVVITMQEVTERADLIRQIRELARHDTLTGLANRDVLQERLEEARDRARTDNSQLALVLCDLDNFKDVNDTLGHAAGDTVLNEVAQRLRASARLTDTVARLGGDEFAVVCSDVASTKEAGLIARSLLAAVDEPIRVQGHRYRLGMSVGVAVDDGERTTEALLRDADIALYEAKKQGKRRWVLHQPAMTVRNQQRLQLAEDLAHALADGDLDVAYQPIVDMQHADRIVGVEALVRWNHPQRGMLMPDEFVDVAESSGLVTAIGRYLLDAALGALRDCLATRPDIVLRMAVNTSMRELREPAFVDTVVTTLHAHNIPARMLVLEVTESNMFDDSDMSLSVMRRLHEQGVRFAVDDFGTGYSSLAYLRRLPVDILKIDRSFIEDIDDPVSVDLVRAIVELGRTLQLDVCAEGVETKRQRDVLERLDCTFAQGYYYGHPMSAAELIAAVTEGARPFVTETQEP